MTTDTPAGWVRIGELSRRVGVSDHVLRAWERRYGLLSPVRTEAGYRLYSDADERRVRRMREHLGRGLSAAEAARAALQEADGAPDPATRSGVRRLADDRRLDAPAPSEVDDLRQRLSGAFAALDEAAAQQAVDALLLRLPLEDALREVLLPYLHDVGDRWHRGEATVTEEHLATQVVRAALTTIARGWSRGAGPRALLACPPGERHDLALLAFGVVLARRGWTITFLGPDTPLASVAEAAERTGPRAVVLAATREERFLTGATELADLAARYPVHLAGPGGTPEAARRTGASLLMTDPVTAAQWIGA